MSETLRERIARVVAEPVGFRWEDDPEGYRLAQADAVLASLDIAQIWDEGFEAGADWVPETLGIPHDPPLNPYHEYPFLGAAEPKAEFGVWSYRPDCTCDKCQVDRTRSYRMDKKPNE